MADCKPLIEAATKDLFRRNAFRITGLPVDATPRDVGRHADKLKMMIELGHGASAHTSAFPLNPPATADQIREATQRLKDSEQRIIDEFFWFWPEDFGQSQNDPAIQALVRGDSGAALQRWRDDETGMVAQHNLAVFWQLAALEREHKLLSGGPDADHRREIEDCWRSSFKYWERLAGDDRLWDMVAARIRQLDDARLTTGFARRMRASLRWRWTKSTESLRLTTPKQAGWKWLSCTSGSCGRQTKVWTTLKRRLNWCSLPPRCDCGSKSGGQINWRRRVLPPATLPP